MKIESNIVGTQLLQVNVGDVFLLDSTYYIRTDDTENTEIVCVDLRSGIAIAIDADTDVMNVNAKVVIE